MVDAGNIVVTGRNGTLDGVTPAEVAKIVARIRTRPQVVIHIHGGLVSEQQGRRTASRLTRIYEDAGADPVFLVWQSNLAEVLRHNLGEIAKEDLFKRLLTRILQFSLGKIWQDKGERATGRLSLPSERDVRDELAKSDADDEPYAHLEPPPDLTDVSTIERAQLEESVISDSGLAATLQEVLAGRHEVTTVEGARGGSVRHHASSASLIDPGALDEIASGVTQGQRALLSTVVLAKKAGAVLIKAVNRFRSRNDHGFYPTVIEELLREFYLANAGGAVWSAMKNETAAAFAASECGARLILDGLAQADPNSFPRLTLVGHSAGAVYIDHLLAEIAKGHADKYRTWPQSARLRVVLLAPANTYTAFTSTLALAKDFVGELRVFTMTDAAERNDRLASRVYPRSLLYFVSGVLERDQSDASSVMPLIGLSRYLQQTDSDVKGLLPVRTYLSGRVVLSPTGPGAPLGQKAEALKHGDFDDDPCDTWEYPGDDCRERVNTYHYAAVVGISRYPGMGDLDGPVRDANDFRNWLIDGGEVPADNIEMLLTPDEPVDNPDDARPGKDEFNRILKQLNDRATVECEDSDKWRRSRLYVYVAGHGIMPSAGETALLLADAQEGFYPHIEVRKYIDWYKNHGGMFREVVFFADCCRNWCGQVDPEAVPFGRSPSGPELDVFGLVGYSCSPGKPSYEEVDEAIPVDERRGYFTTALINGLRGGASIDPAVDAITSMSLARYVRVAVDEATRRKRFPQRVEMLGDLSHPMRFGKPQGAPAYNVTVRFPETWVSRTIEILHPDGTRVSWEPPTPWQGKLRDGIYAVVSPGTLEFVSNGLFQVNGDCDVQL